jgi:hypothetical protein
MRLFAILFLLALVSLGPNKVHAQAMNPSLDVYYTTERSSKLFYPNDTTRTYMHLKLREPVVMLEDRQDGWSKVKTLDGANGLMRTEGLTNVWIRISKSEQTVFVYRGSTLIARIPADLGYNLLNYPNAEDAERGFKDNLITEKEYKQILQAEKSVSAPPMNTRLGGYIELHGDGTGERQNWTQGCVAIQNVQMDRLWDLVVVGTPVMIES